MEKNSISDYLPTKYWLMKTEPDVFSFADLVAKGEEFWDGVRNYQARNFMRDHMKLGHKILFYHSNADPSGIVGICEVVKEALPDLSSLNKKSEYYDPKATKDEPRWCAVTVGRPQKFKNFLSLDELKKEKSLSNMLLLRKGQRLSVQPVTEHEWNYICKLGF